MRQHLLVQVSICPRSSSRSAFNIEQVSICLYKSAFVNRSSRSAFNIKQVSILRRVCQHFLAQVSIRIPIISIKSSSESIKCINVTIAFTLLGNHQAGQHLISNRSAFYAEYVSIRIPIIWASALLPPFTILGKHQAGQHSISDRSAFSCACQHSYTNNMEVFQYSYRRLPYSENIKQVSILYI